MKKIITLCTAAALFLCVAAQAQPGNTPEQRAKKLTRQMNKTLNLSKTQKKKVAEINLTYIRKQEELKIRQEEGISQEQYHQDLLRLVAERNHELKEALSTSQYNIYMEYDNVTRKILQQEKKKQQQDKKQK
ncbi:MAG: DUF4890 domain-containing protein [Prevotellaceae bacterium]|jgi:alkyl sulfatase BDS1-like metallo-beta-lactamase superfamily hydrolase|nr:DUF4890 domain-containing protein [Prevotellaceae bacterium]